MTKLLVLMLSRPLPTLSRRASADLRKTNGPCGRRFANPFRCTQALNFATLSIAKLLVMMLGRPLPNLDRRASADFAKTNGPCGRRFANPFRCSQALNFANLSIAKLLVMMLSRPLPNLRRRASADFAKTNGPLGRRFANPFRCTQALNFATLSIAKLLVMMLGRPLPNLGRRASADFAKTNGPCGRRFANPFWCSQALNFANLSIAKLLVMMLSRPLPNLRRRASADFVKTNAPCGRRFANPFWCT